MNYRTVFLQRLANPLAPYHPITNPYLTIDWMPVDLTVFNGEDRKPAGWDDPKGPWDPDDTYAKPDGTLADNFDDQDQTRGVQFAATRPVQHEWLRPKTPTTISGANGLIRRSADSDDEPTPGSPNLFNLGGEDPALNMGPDPSLTKVNFRFNLNDTTTVTDSGTSPRCRQCIARIFESFIRAAPRFNVGQWLRRLYRRSPTAIPLAHLEQSSLQQHRRTHDGPGHAPRPLDVRVRVLTPRRTATTFTTTTQIRGQSIDAVQPTAQFLQFDELPAAGIANRSRSVADVRVSASAVPIRGHRASAQSADVPR